MRVLIIVMFRRMTRDTRRGLRHPVPLTEACAGELPGQLLHDLLGEGRAAGGDAADAGEVVLPDDGVVDQTDDDGRDEGEVGQLVFDDGAQHRVHAEGGEHQHFVVGEDGGGAVADEAGDLTFWLEKKGLGGK